MGTSHEPEDLSTETSRTKMPRTLTGQNVQELRDDLTSGVSEGARKGSGKHLWVLMTDLFQQGTNAGRQEQAGQVLGVTGPRTAPCGTRGPAAQSLGRDRDPGRPTATFPMAVALVREPRGERECQLPHALRPAKPPPKS